MVHRCGLNRLNQFAAFLCNHLRASRMDPKFLSLLTNFDEVLYSGMPLAREEEEWAYRNGIKLRVRSSYYTLAYYSKPYLSRICLGALKPGRRCFRWGAPKATQPSCGRSPERHTALCPLEVRRRQRQHTSRLHKCSSLSFSPSRATAPTSRCVPQTDTSTPEIFSKKWHRDCIFLAAGTTTGSSPRTACAAIQSTLN